MCSQSVDVPYPRRKNEAPLTGTHNELDVDMGTKSEGLR